MSLACRVDPLAIWKQQFLFVLAAPQGKVKEKKNHRILAVKYPELPLCKRCHLEMTKDAWFFPVCARGSTFFSALFLFKGKWIDICRVYSEKSILRMNGLAFQIKRVAPGEKAIFINVNRYQSKERPHCREDFPGVWLSSLFYLSLTPPSFCQKEMGESFLLSRAILAIPLIRSLVNLYSASIKSFSSSPSEIFHLPSFVFGERRKSTLSYRQIVLLSRQFLLIFFYYYFFIFLV